MILLIKMSKLVMLLDEKKIKLLGFKIVWTLYE